MLYYDWTKSEGQAIHILKGNLFVLKGGKAQEG